MNDNQIIYMGVNAPRIHQAIIGRLIYWLTDLYLKNKTELIAYPEAMIDESENGTSFGSPDRKQAKIHLFATRLTEIWQGLSCN